MARIAWVADEKEAQRRGAADLRPFLGITRLVHPFAEAAIRLQTVRPSSLATHVQLQLLAQASNQLRVVALAANHGYALQALGATATLYEHVSALGFVDQDNDRAAAWRAHTDSRNTYPPIQ